ncbi:MAG: hypothetical protein Q9162_005300 [Coniocarpon cinnabarinum]
MGRNMSDVQTGRISMASVSRDSLFGEPRPRSRNAQSAATACNANKSGRDVSGLGLYVESTRHQSLANNKLSAAARFAASQYPPINGSPGMTPTEFASERSEPANASPSRHFSEHVIKQRADARLAGLGITRPSSDGAGPQEVDEIATEVATPSIVGTSEARDLDGAMNQVRAKVSSLHQDVTRLHASPNLALGRDKASPNAPNIHPGPGVRLRASVAGHAGPTLETNDNSGVSSVLENLASNVASLRHLLAETPNLGVSLGKLGQRVDALETASFAHSAIEEHNDRFEQFEGHMIDVESRLGDLEKFCDEWFDTTDSDGDQTSRIAGGLLQEEDLGQGPTPLINMQCVQGVVNHRMKAIQRLRNVEKRLGNLNTMQAASDCTQRIEVVFLPWGPGLKGTWYTPNDASQASGRGCLPAALPTDMTQSVSPDKLNGLWQKSANQNFTFDDASDEWPNAYLTARAIGPTPGMGGRVYERLKSRGFVRNVAFPNGSARTVYDTICKSFADVLQMTSHSHSRRGTAIESDHLTQTPLLALRSAFVPLRKIHKASRLRFLSISELATPALWTLPFLESSVFMKAPSIGVTRLFITTPSAYLQSQKHTSWTWQRLRELPRVPEQELEDQRRSQKVHLYGDGVPEADAHEPCWEYEPKLDPSPSQQTSFASNVSFESSHHPSPPRSQAQKDGDNVEGDPDYEQSSGEDFSELSSADPQRCVRHPDPITPTSEIPSVARPSLEQRRTASLPAIQSHAPAHITLADQPHPKHTVTSFDHTLKKSDPDGLLVSSQPSSSLSKRRRLSRTPSGRTGHDDAPWALTPSRSHNPDEEAEMAFQEYCARNGVEVSVKDRSAAAYATPYSFGVNKSLRAAQNVDISMSDNESSSDDQEDEGDVDTDMDSDLDFASESDESMSHSSQGMDPAFVDEPTRSVESEAEIEAAVTLEEEAWEGTGHEEDDSDESDTSKRKRDMADEVQRRNDGWQEDQGKGLGYEESDAFAGFDEEDGAIDEDGVDEQMDADILDAHSEGNEVDELGA